MSIDSIGDFLTIIRNGVRASKKFVIAPHSNMKQAVAQILKDEGFINDFAIEEQDGQKVLKVALRYYQGKAVIHELKRMSKPGLRVYAGCREIEPVISGLGVAIVSTSQGIMTDKTARQKSLGGEIICTVW
jgi:small subunit ribosomal protein S8